MNWQEAEIVFQRLPPKPRCPECGTDARPITVRSMATEGDGSKTRRVVCRECSTRFLIVSEPEEDSAMARQDEKPIW